ncbi:isoleucyl-tRNA synthetase [Candidatus Nanopelagicus limnes]|uniref:Isoleucine--tRNA ligase n=1 Tax=Candidatus Nanopelagicus limnae TaxID=1884634 RepID=A0A249JY54_9ACTN|nr:isoleucine--tRNA ligase [Candidatus Nanopelagicus limnes]ASY09454.1 isoleucyl-tRNA synthetase [Candidatus Nanopelagicus limnes]
MNKKRKINSLPAQIDLPAMEMGILDFWTQNQVFEKSVENRNGAARWSFYEGPPTANGKPGTHHIEARVFKDLFPRFQTMKGKQVIRKAGWDCHGLPVEIAVEKELGFTGKADIEKFGVAAFNEKCKESVQRHVDEFTDMTKRMGFWVDFDEAYWTMSPEYIESVWWSLQQIWNKGLLVQDHRVAPYCPRCGTGLSDHELAQGYETIKDPSVFVRFPVTSGKLAELKASLLVWTTTPWTLVSNTAVAVNPKVEYQVVEITVDEKTERLVVAADLASVLGEDRKVIATFIGKDLEHTKYSRPFDFVEINDSHFVVLADYVTVEDGTGLVHQSPAFGADDLEVCRKYNLPVVNPVNPDGHFQKEVPLIGGVFFKDADKALIKDLKSRGLMFKSLQFEHSYPHCWRCHTALMYYAQPSWYVKTTAIKEDLLRENSKTNWHPETIKTGRFGDWLNNNIDWAVSRNRYWGTPLPIWRCENKHEICVGSLAELGKLAGQELSKLDPHRPFVDDIKFKCDKCSETMQRIPEVIDCWYDSGAMPFAQWGYPRQSGSVEKFNATYPADFICEAIDQTRGWFYTLMTIGTLVFDKSSYKTVLCLGHILDKDGRKMSKHLGNVLEPMPLMNQHGADAVRWYMLAAGSPWSARRVGHDAISDVVRKTLLTYWNTISFFTLYANAADFEVSKVSADLTLMDKWILSELNKLIVGVDKALENFDSQEAGQLLAAFIDDLSNWYVRRSRRRFWDGDEVALNTLYFCLKNLTLLLAPMVPFIAEHVWQSLIKVAEADQVESVHLADFPEANKKMIDENLSTSVALSRRLVELGRSARAESGVKIRQPLSRALVSAPGWAKISEEIKTHIAEELNILKLDGIHVAEADLVDVSVKANFRTLGTKFGADVQIIAKAITSANHTEMVKHLRENKSFKLSVDLTNGSKSAEIDIDDLVVTETPRTGWSVASHAGESLALDLALTPELIQSGLVREVIRAIQEERKKIGLDVSDRISVNWNAPDQVASAITSAVAEISAEVLATNLVQDKGQSSDGNELGLWLNLVKN